MIPEETLVGKLHRKLGYPDRRSLLLGATFLVIVIVLGGALYWWGIRDDDPPGTNVSGSTSPSVRPTGSQPVEQPPAMPEAAKQNTMDGVRAFVRYYFDLANYAQRTNDAEPIKAVQLGSCEGCKGQIELLETIARDKQRTIGGKYTLKTVSVTPVEPSYLCVARFSREAASIVDSNGNTVEGYGNEVADGTLVLGVAWVENGWKIHSQRPD